MERQHQNNHRNNNNNNTNQNGDSNSIQTVFETVTTMVQNSSPPLALPDELKLSLYGLYKRSTIGTTTMNEYEYPPPSRWNIVANRKYQAWVECNGLNEHESMIGYVELVAGLDCDLGRECQVILLEILEEKEQQQQQQLRGEEYHQLESKTSSHHLEDDNGVEDETVATSTTTAATIKTTTSNSKSLQSFRKKRSATLNTPKVTSQSSFMTKMTGIQPFTPRGQIDISTMDIVSTFVSTIPSCISSISSSLWNKNNYCHHNNMHKTVQLEIDIATSWKEQHITMNGNNNDNNTHISSSSSESSMIMMNHVITGLSVRTLLDLYLSSKSFPKDSEVIIVPPISIEGMIDVIQYHDINIVPIDIDDYKKDIGNNEGASTPIIHVNLDRVRSAITSKTIAVMIVHPFGLVCMDDNDMKELKVMLQEESLRHDRRNDDNAIEIWEDCAECYTGGNSSDSLHGYSGSSYANLQLYSFGVIKTATSLGGGIAILKQQKNIADKMKRLQHMTYEEQKTTDYFVKVCKVLVLHFLSRNVIVLSLLVQFLDVLGLDYDHLVTSSVRGFPVATEKEKSHRLNRRSKELIIEQRKDRARLLVERLRKRPCPALLSLLHKRILQSSQTLKTVQTRIHRCESMKVLLQRKKMSLKIPKGLNSSIHLHWLFPIVVDNPELFTSYMKKRGYDVPRGASQLGCVNTFLFDTDSAQSCPNTEWMMNHIVYLSIASIPMKKERIENFTQALDKATVNIEPNMKGRSRHFTKLKCYIIVCVCIDGYITRFIPFSSTCYSTIRWLFVTFTYCALPVMVGIFILLHIARSTMGKYYLKCSSAFAKYNTIFGEKSTFKNAVSVSNEMLNESGLVVLGSAEKFQQSTDLFESSSLALPNRENLPDSARQSENMVLLTGSTGFIGSLLLRELLLHREKLHINGVIVICRSKRNMSAEERMDDLMKKPMFSFLTENEKMKLVVVMEGDVASTNIGMKEADLQRLKCEFDVSHVFNCAACVNFTETLENAAESNITSALQIQQLIKKLKNKNATYTYLSTAFIHGNQLGSSEKPLTEDLFDFGKYDPVELYKSMMTTQSCASKAMNELGFPNTYTFSKSVCEHLLMYEKDVKTIIVRPSIVGPSIQEPYEGWAGDKPSTLVAGACLYMNNPYNLWSFRRERASVIPVDVVCRFVLSKAFRDEVIPLCKSDEDSSKLSDESCRSSESSYVITKSSTVNSYSSESGSSLSFIEDKVDKQIFTAAWDTKSPSKTGFLWYEFACAIVQLSTVHGHVEMSIAYFVLLVSFRIFLAMNLTFDSFQKVHRILVHGPFCIITHIYHLIGTQPKLLNIFEKLRPFLDLPLLFFPFTTSTFHFTSELIAPSSLNGERYMFACILAAENFVNAMKQKMSKDSNNQKRKQEYNYTNYLIAGKEHTNLSSDAWWALAQPNGSYIIRFIGMIIRKMLRLSTTAVTIDMDTMTKVTRAIDESTDDIKPYLVLAPTHRSFYDFIILSYITFALPECGIPVPYIVAADDFSRLPLLGWIAQLAGAFFVSRGKGIPDPKLKAKVASLKKNDTYDSPSCIEVFLEGRRSRDRRFLQPKTGFLRCLNDTGGKYLLVPITINYERIPEQAALSCEVDGNFQKKMNLKQLFSWLKRVYIGEINLGRIHVCASNPLLFDTSKQIQMPKVTNIIQIAQQRKVYVTNYHIDVGAHLLGLSSMTMKKSLEFLHCPILNDFGEKTISIIPSKPTESWTIFLQYGHIFSPFLRNTHPEWAHWLSPLNELKREESTANMHMKETLLVLISKFEAAEEALQQTLRLLNAKGFNRPSVSHILQYVDYSDFGIPSLLIRAAYHMHNKSTIIRKNQQLQVEPDSSIHPLFKCIKSDKIEPKEMKFKSIESFGAWGFKDSKFIVSVQKDGAKCVTMQGDRYKISGRPMPNLIPFLETETKVRVDVTKSVFSSTSTPLVASTDLSDNDIRLIVAELQGEEHRVSVQPLDRARHGTGHSQEDMYNIRSHSLSNMRVPDAVVYADSETEISCLISLAARKEWCIIPFGGGTNVSHATWCPPKAIEPRPIISLDIRLMNRVLEVNEEDSTIRVEAGITGSVLVRELQKLGYTMGHEPDSIEFSTVGGWIATNSSGMKQNKYGNIENIVKDVRVANTQGLLWQHSDGKCASFGRVSIGTNLTSLMFGSEGSLGIITSAVLKIWPLPAKKEYQSVILHNFEDGIRFVKDVATLGALKPASIRLLDNTQFRLGQAMKSEMSVIDSLKRVFVKTYAKLKVGEFLSEEMVCATVTFEGSVIEVELQQKLIVNIASKHGGLCAGSEIGKAGYEMTYAIAYIRDFAMTYGFLAESFETFVPWSKVADLVSSTLNCLRLEHKNRLLPGNPILCCRITQLYDEGVCVYFYFCMNFMNVQNPSKVFSEIEVEARKTILLKGGSLSHHHGIGKAKASFMKQVNSDSLNKLLIKMKEAFDPQNIFGVRNGSFQ